MNFRSAIGIKLVRDAERYRLSSRLLLWITWLPVGIVLLTAVLFALPATRHAIAQFRYENSPIELATFITLAWGGCWGLLLAARARRAGVSRIVAVFYRVMALGLLLVAMEEISWGQSLVTFPTPEELRSLNLQGETNLHNLEGIQGSADWLRLTFGLGGLIGIGLSRTAQLDAISAPLVLLSWCLIIVGHSLLDVLADFGVLGRSLKALVSWYSELIEMFIGFAGLIYMWLNARALKIEELARRSRSSPPIAPDSTCRRP